jgi:hypothetical protein
LINGISDGPACGSSVHIAIYLGSTINKCNESQYRFGDVFNDVFYPWG